MKNILLLLVLILFSFSLKSQQNINDYDKICYCSGKTPHSILSYDNNWQLLWAFKNGLSKKELDSLHIPYTDSQLRLMSLFKLIKFEKDKYYTKIPVYDAHQTLEMRKGTRKLAELIAPFIEKDIKSLVTTLDAGNHSGNQFSIVFSYVLDGLVWNKFEEKKMVTSLDLNSSNWPWTGTFWLLTPPRNNRFGTNSQYDSICSFNLTHGPFNLKLSIYDEEDGLIETLLRNYIASGKATDNKVIKAFEKYNMVNSKGEIQIPVIVENRQDKIYSLSERIADTICNHLVSNDIFKNMIHDFNIPEEQQAIIILYHEVMWDLLSIIEEKKLIKRPFVMTNSEKATIKDLGDLMFLVKEQ